MMNKTLQHNLESMGKKYSKLKEYFLDFDQSIKKDEDKNEILAGTQEIAGREILFALKDDKQYQLDSLYSHEEVLKVWINQYPNVIFNSKALFFGFGNGMFVRHFLNQVTESGGILIYEPSIAIFEKVISTFDISDLLENEKVCLYIEGYGEETIDLYMKHHILIEDIPGMISFSYLNYQQLFQEKYQTFVGKYHYYVDMAGADDNLLFRFGTWYYDNSISNMPVFKQGKSLEELSKKITSDIPAFIVSAGPSLDSNIEELKKVKNRGIIIALDTTLNPLLKHDIIPDLFVTVDVAKMDKHFTDERYKKIPVVGMLISNRAVISNHEAPCFFINDMNAHMETFLNSIGKELPLMNTGGSVANNAFSLARYLGVKTIVLVGQDLAFTNNQTHSLETEQDTYKIDIKSKIYIEVEGYNGGVVCTSPELELYLRWFENEVDNHPEVEVINATEGGARIKGTKQMSLKEAIECKCKGNIDIQAIIEETPDFLSDEEKLKFTENYRNLPVRLKEFIYPLNKGIRDYEKMLELVLRNDYQNKEMIRLFNNTKRVTELMEESCDLQYALWYMKSTENELMKDIYVIKDDEKEELKETISRGIKYFKTLKEMIVKLTDHMENYSDLFKK